MGVVRTLATLAAGAGVGVGSLGATLAADHGVPERASTAYIAAARNAPCQIDYRIITAIGAIESGHGSSGGATFDQDTGQLQKDIVSEAGAEGFTQFMPSTWAAYGVDADGDGKADPNDVDDAAASTAAYLCANGGDANIDDALWNYNHDWSYVATVKENAAKLPADDGSGVPAAPTSGGAPADEGRICGVGEAFAAPGDCASSAADRAAYLWANLGDDLDSGDTERLYAIWSKLNGKPVGADAPLVQPGPGKGIAKDLPNLPGSEGLQPDFAAKLARMVAYAPGSITINQGWRSPEDALSKWNDTLGKYGSEDEARNWVAKTVQDDNGTIQCGSNHCKGLAADLAYADSDVLAWAHNHAVEFGLTFPLANENWHIEPEGIR